MGLRREEMRVAKRAVVALLVALALFHIMGCVSGATVQRTTREFPQGTGFQTRIVTVDQQERKFAVFVPRDYSAGKKYPTIVFLHGLFESGRDARRCLSAGFGAGGGKGGGDWAVFRGFSRSIGGGRGGGNE